MFRFTIRDVLWLTVVAALAVGWLVDRSYANYVLIDAINKVAHDWAKEVGHPVQYSAVLHGGRKYNAAMGP